MSKEDNEGACPYSGRLSAFFDGETGAEERRSIELHLTQCPSCAKELEEIASISTMLRAAYAPEAGEDFRGRVRSSVGRGRNNVLVRLAAELTAAAAIVLAASLVYILADAPGAPQTAQDEASLAVISVEMAEPAFPESPEEEQLARYILADLSQEGLQ